MNRILIFAGTTEGRKLSECLSQAGIPHTVCVATEYGEDVLKANIKEGFRELSEEASSMKMHSESLIKIHRGRMDRDEIAEFIKKGNYMAVVDATHPYAEEITENIKVAMQGMSIPYLRLKRANTNVDESDMKISYFDTNEACVKALERTEGNILLTTGIKELSAYCTSDELKSRLYVRVLPGIESLTFCTDQGIIGKQILALQGPFTVEMNEAMFRQYQIKHLVTKASGKAGGFGEKLEAAKRVDIPVCVIGNHEKEGGYSFAEVCEKLESISGKRIKKPDIMEIILAGVGMGSRNNLTKEVYQAIENADILMGAERMIVKYQPKIEKKPFYKAEQIIPYLHEIQNNLTLENIKVVILFSGDSGFYSGCHALYKALQTEIGTGSLHASIHIMPGISSVSYLSACIGESYQDTPVYSIHGKELPNLTNRIQKEEKSFILMSGAKDINKLGKLLMDAGMDECEIMAGYQLSYPEQQIRILTPQECCEVKEEGLYTCYIKNPHARLESLTHGRADADFIRNKDAGAYERNVPMTKEEVREVSICKLRLHKGATVYDIGSGTGSIAIEIAGLSDDIQVFAIEREKEAVCLIEKNIEKRRIENISVINAGAPDAFLNLPVPSHAFIGGSGGRLKEILSKLCKLNSEMRVVINAVSMETIAEMKEILSLYPVENEEIIQMQVSRAKAAGQYHLMQAENPVWICAFDFKSKHR